MYIKQHVGYCNLIPLIDFRFILGIAANGQLVLLEMYAIRVVMLIVWIQITYSAPLLSHWL